MKNLVESYLTFENDSDEASFVDRVIQESTNARDLLGVDIASREYKVGSLMWRWDTYQKSYEQDFEWRKPEAILFQESNYSLNLPLTPISQHGDKMANDLFGSPAFFGPAAEGSEDENPEIDVLQQRLEHRSNLINLHETGKAAMLGALIRGQEIIRAGLNEGVYMKPVVTKGVLLDGKPLEDSQGVPILSTDKWVRVETLPDVQVLERDNSVQVPIGAQLMEGKPKVVMQRVSQEPGCEMTIIHYGDFFCSVNAETLDASPIKGHVFLANPGDLLLSYDESTHVKANFDAYMEMVKNNSLPGQSPENTYAVKAELNRVRDGENEQVTALRNTSDPKAYRRRMYMEVWFRYDANKDGYDEDIYVLLDVEAKIPVHYEYAHLILPWSEKEHPHPYICQRIWPKLKRWTGKGYYELLQTWAIIADKMLNRIEVDANTSGNVIFEDPDGTMQGIDGQGVQMRSGEKYQLRAGKTRDEVFGAVTVQPVNVEVFSGLMEKVTGRAEISAGLTSPAEASVADVPGQDTLGVAKILENTSNQSLRARESEIVTGATAMLHAFVEIELYAIQHTQGGMEALVRQVGQEKAAGLVQWIQTFPEDIRNVFEISLTKSHSSQMVETGNAIVGVLNQFAALPGPFQRAFSRIYSGVLKGLGEPNPDETLQAAEIASQQVAAQQAALAAEQAQAGQEPPMR